MYKCDLENYIPVKFKNKNLGWVNKNNKCLIKNCESIGNYIDINKVISLTKKISQKDTKALKKFRVFFQIDFLIHQIPKDYL